MTYYGDEYSSSTKIDFSLWRDYEENNSRLWIQLKSTPIQALDIQQNMDRDTTSRTIASSLAESCALSDNGYIILVSR